ncbi:MAG: phosphoadenylyl-sulfate reductase [Chloroflexota bacterium]|nr:phosphoadenylyl-sulfate reductase [Chloroflexota bacterium]MDE2941838.1 phosphoadenylyl-sulfate reductase [Chloroflexota bacterium]MDE3268310.1 phosphoadenylyl-sulfate reductase [Chloroflexota bacterium]
MLEQMEPLLSNEEIEEKNREFEGKSPEAVLEWAIETFHPRLALSSSFGAEDVALIDMMWRIDPSARVFTLETLRLHTETYTLMDQIRMRYGMDVENYYPDMEQVAGMVKEHGFNLFYKSEEFRKLCCGIRKMEPLDRALGTVDAWISGLRRDQAVTRVDIGKVELDSAHGNRIKINPLAEWSSDKVWAYIHENKVPYNELHDNGFPSIGCAPCTRAVSPDEDPRAGRWWWESDPNSKECGLHVIETLDSIKAAAEKGR